MTARHLRDAEVARLVRQIGTQVIRVLRRRGKWPDRDAEVGFGADEPWLLQCEAAAVQGLTAELMRRVFSKDVLVCGFCGGPRRELDFVVEPDALRRILEHVGLEAEVPRVEPARGPPALPFADAGGDGRAAESGEW